MPELRECTPCNMSATLRFSFGKYLEGFGRDRMIEMGIATPAKARNQHVLRKMNQWVRHYPGSGSTPSQQALESNSRDAYFWRR